MAKLNMRERARIQRLWASDQALTSATWASLPADVSNEFNREVVAAMAAEGKQLEIEGGNFYGGEAAQRVMEMVHGWIASELQRYADAIQRLCKDLDYCAKRRAKVFEDEGWAVAIAVGDALLQIVTHVPIPMAVLSVYIIKRGILDTICKCR